MKFGILVVYFLDDSDIELLNLHLRMIELNSAGKDYKIYGIANRVSDRVKDVLSSCTQIDIVKMQHTNLVGSQEHSYYLDKLISYALNDGCSHLLTLDCDAFPINPRWLDSIAEKLTKEVPVVAVFRAENGDRYLPHPSMTCFTSNFYKNNNFSFYPGDDAANDPGFRGFLNDTKQNVDSGIGLGYLLCANNISWHKLLRSNKRNDHYLLAGIYGDIVFHLGSMSWGEREYRLDRSRSLRIRIAVFIRTHLIHCPAGSFRRMLLNKFELPAIKRIRTRNNEIYRKIRSRLISDPDGYINSLRGISASQD